MYNNLSKKFGGKQADKYGVPRMCFVNKMDRIGADFYRCVEMMKDRLGAVPLVLQLPIGSEENFVGVVDLIKMQAIIWKNDSLGAEFTYQDIPQELMEKASEYRKLMCETAVEMDDEIFSKYLNEEDLSEEDIKKCIRKGTIEGKFVPVINGSAFKNKGVQPLLDAVIDH